MSLLERYKKSGGFLQLLNLLETCSQQKRDKFLSMIKEENPIWEAALRPRILNIDRVFNWTPAILGEILTRLQSIHIAGLYSTSDKERQNLIMNSLSFSQNNQVKQFLDVQKFTSAEVGVSIEKFLNETRSLIGQGVIKLDKIDPEMEVPKNFEEKLSEIQNQVLSKEISKSSLISLQKKSDSIKVKSEVETGSHSLGSVKLVLKDNSLVEKETQMEIDRLKEKIHILTQENFVLKNENEILKGMIDRSKKTA
jgi:hypothetical protein